MTILSARIRYVLDRPWRFAGQVVAGFRANQGFLLAGAVAYYTLLSTIPMFALILVLLSQFRETPALLTALQEYLVLVAPGQAEALVAQISVFLDNWKVVGLTGLALLLAAHLTGGVRLLMLEFLAWRDWQKSLLATAAGITLLAGLVFLLNL